MRAFPVAMPSGSRYWTVVNEELTPATRRGPPLRPRIRGGRCRAGRCQAPAAAHPPHTPAVLQPLAEALSGLT